MKIILSYAILAVYATIMIKPIMPTLADGFAHLLNYQDHIATVHKHNGKSHTHFEYIEAARNQADKNNPLNTNDGFKKVNFASEHFLVCMFKLMNEMNPAETYYPIKDDDLLHPAVNTNFRPPSMFFI